MIIHDLLSDIRDDYYDTWLNIKFEILKNFRQRRYLIVGIIAVIIPSLFYIIPKSAGNAVADSIEDFISSIMGFTELIIVLCGIFFGADALNSERYHKTSLITFTLPQRRTSIFNGKLIAQILSSWLMITLYYSSTMFFAGIEFGFDLIPVENTTKSVMFSFLYMTALMAGAFFLSSVVRNPSISMMLTFFVIFMLLPIATLLLGFVDIETTYVITNYSSFITSVFRFPTGNFGPPGGSSSTFTIQDGMNLSIIYFLVFGFIAWYLNNKKEA